MFIFPTGSVAEVSRRPWVTYAVMAACVATFAATTLDDRGTSGLDGLIDETQERPWLVDETEPTPPELSQSEVDTERAAFEARLSRDLDQRLERRLALVPKRGLAQWGWLTALFVHFGVFHLLGNLFFLWIVGPLLEEAWGPLRYGALYLAFGLAASATQYSLSAGTLHAIGGASGAIAGCMGAFAIRFAATRVRFFYFVWVIRIFYGTFTLPAWFAGLFWFGREALNLVEGGESGVATGAHVGGFVMGSLIALGTKALGWEKSLKTVTETSEEHTQHEALLNDAAGALRLGDFDGARATLQRLLSDVPSYPGAELMLAEAEVRARRSCARLEKLLRPRIKNRADIEVVPLLSRLWPDLSQLPMTDGFLWALLERVEQTNNRDLTQAVLQKLAAGSGKHAVEARKRLDRAPEQIALDVPSGPVDIRELMTTGSRPAFKPSSPEPAPRAAPVVMSGALVAVSPSQLEVVIDGRQRPIPFAAMRAIEAAVVPLDGRGVLLVDFVLKTPEGKPPMAIRVSGADPLVPSLFPKLPVPEAWATLIHSARRAMGAPEAAAWRTLPSADELTAQWR